MTTNWVPGLWALGIGTAAAIAFLLLSRRAKSAAAPATGADAVLGDLNAKFQSLLDQRRALEAERHAMEASKFSEEATRLERAAAEVLRARDERARTAAGASAALAASHGQTAAAPVGFRARNPQLVGALWGALVVGFFGILAVILVQEQKPRTDDGVMTGKTPPSSAPAPTAQAARDPQFEQMVDRARSTPEDSQTVGLVTHELMRMGRLDEAHLLVERGLSLNPFDTELRVHRSVLASLRGEVTKAERELTHLVDTYPDAQEALLFLAAMKMQTRQNAEALAHLERYYAESPPAMVPRELLETIHGLRAELGR